MVFQPMKSVFMVKSPLQLLNAVEAKYYFDLKTDDCVLIIMGDRKSQPQILTLSNVLNEWRSVIILNEVNLFFGDPLKVNKDFPLWKRIWQSGVFAKSFFNVRRLNRISNKLGNVNHIFMGYARYIYMRHFVNITRHENVFLLDDGHATLQLAKERRQGTAQNAQTDLTKRIKLWAKRYLQGVQHEEKESLCFFTIYDVSADGNDRVIRHNFEHIRSKLSGLDVTDTVYFLGSPVVRAGVINQPDYVTHLTRVRDYFQDKNLVYVAHRRESQQHLEEISQNLNMKVIKFDYPIEYQLAVVGPRPEILASFFSSALDSCRLIFGDYMKIVSFKLDVKDSPKRDQVEAIYADYRSSENENFVVEEEY